MNVAQEFEPLYRAARTLELRGDIGEAALVTITRTQGSTFRRAGASMLVRRDGSLVCELSGGCPQRDIVLRAREAMATGEPAVVAYGRNSNYDVMLETGCGGELEVLIEPWLLSDDVRFLEAIEALRVQRTAGVMATLYATAGHALSRRPYRLVWGNDSVWTNIGQPDLERQILAVTTTQSAALSVATAIHVEHAGQRHEILLETLHPPHALVIIGDGVGAHMLAALSLQLGWHTTLVGTGEPADPAPAGVEHVVALPHALTSTVAFDHQTSAVVMTHRLERDLAYATSLMGTPVRYIGVIGSRQRASQIRAIFPEDDRLHAPAGLDVGSETPAEIALAIAAEILALRNGRRGGPLVHSQMPIHP
ncbi:XdhC family protein [Dyella telluris]|uniref:XdhC family protein n=1 Tax=Dyella telluris TaxID=2763498 RepID=A0A7G8Q373_9GAMM|nr:XdhC family protein [Dyella telluris]QNK01231.1 XdhC family protein [Dyella telluris]